MKIRISQTELQNALNIVQKGVSTRSTLPALAGIHLEAKDDVVVFQTSDLELSIQYEAPAFIEEEGRAVLPGKLFCDIVKNLPDAAVYIDASVSEAVIVCETSSFTVKALDPIDFPGFPEVEVSQTITLPYDAFSSMAKRVSRFASTDESRIITTGVLVKAEDSKLIMVATDGHRLASAERPIEGLSEDFEAVITPSFINNLASLPKTGDDINLALAENQIVVSYRDMKFINRRIEGNYPNYKALMPKGFKVSGEVDVRSFESSVKRISLLGQSGVVMKLSFMPEINSINLSSATMDVGSAQEDVSADLDGEETVIGFNSSFIIDGLNCAQSDTMVFAIQDSGRAGILKDEKNDNFTYIIMPIRLD